jgi:hypothetical protein
MICDDEAACDVCGCTEKGQYNVLSVNSGKACVEKHMEYTLNGNKIDVMLLDYRLGDSLGNDIAARYASWTAQR